MNRKGKTRLGKLAEVYKEKKQVLCSFFRCQKAKNAFVVNKKHLFIISVLIGNWSKLFSFEISVLLLGKRPCFVQFQRVIHNKLHFRSCPRKLPWTNRCAVAVCH